MNFYEMYLQFYTKMTQYLLFFNLYMIKTLLWTRCNTRWCYYDGKMFIVYSREPRLTPARLAEEYLEVLYWSRPCCGPTVHRPKWGVRTVCDVILGTKNSRVAGGSRRSKENPPRVHLFCDGQQSVGHCIF